MSYMKLSCLNDMVTIACEMYDVIVILSDESSSQVLKCVVNPFNIKYWVNLMEDELKQEQLFIC